MTVNPQAIELNNTIDNANPYILNMLSQRGKEIFFPKTGILSQSADAKVCKINATIGTALEDDCSPMFLKSISENIELSPKDVFSYAPSYGRMDIREKWKNFLEDKNPSLSKCKISLPVTTNALTHGLSMSAYLFCNPEDEILLPDMFWGNYKLIFENGYGAKLKGFVTFSVDGGFNVDALKNALSDGKIGKKIVLLNFPNNPTGYTPTEKEAFQIRDEIVASAEKGNDIVVLCDDAYFGLVYENGIFKESIFSLLANAHERVLAVKVDGPTKEDYVWGFRVGFLTFGSKANSEDMYKALEAKVAGAVRGNISNASNLAQSLLLNSYNSESYTDEKTSKYRILKIRYDKIKNILATRKEYSEMFEPQPFNSGYFMCVKLKHSSGEAVRQILLKEYSTGVIALGNLIRIAFSSCPFDMLEELFENIYNASKKANEQ